jgi:PAS domain-containing protein
MSRTPRLIGSILPAIVLASPVAAAARIATEPAPLPAWVTAALLVVAAALVVLLIRERGHRGRRERDLGASEARWRMFMEQASDGIFVADPNLKFVEVNAAACEMLGYTRAELLARSVPDVVLDLFRGEGRRRRRGRSPRASAC